MSRSHRQPVIVIAAATVSALLCAGWIQRLERGVEVSPPVVADAAIPTPAGAAQVTKAADGHFWAQARIDGRAVKVLVDTGASVVALTPEDAARLGLRPSPGEFRHSVQTANGQTLAAAVTLDEVRIGSARVEDVEALIVRDGLPYSLLGMSYLGRLSAFEARSGSLILRP